ncbi:MAG: HemK/PrmC family methyltransferase [Actinomycetaceae bacterium]|nr:HemK/PrmC family methyltransferase [Actinomycetaceae bacterium]MDU0970445.1 HemK/PrmC family methyltransferase [Actinomycetaceae bacterium]
MKLAHALSEGAYVLAEAGVDAPMADSRQLAEHLLGCPLYMAPPALTPEVEADFFRLIGRRAAREPLQHITGTMTFRFLTLAAAPGVFITRPETEWMVDAALVEIRRLARQRRVSVVDWCAGSGAIGLAIASEVAGVDVVAVELDPAAAALARKNAQANPPDPDSTWRLIEADATRPDTLADRDGCVDVIVTNPPYVPAGTITQPEALADPDLALYGGGADGLAIPRALLSRAADLLSGGGICFMEHADDQNPALAAACVDLGLASALGKDQTGRIRWIVARKSAGDVEQ